MNESMNERLDLIAIYYHRYCYLLPLYVHYLLLLLGAYVHRYASHGMTPADWNEALGMMEDIVDAYVPYHEL